MKRKLDFTFMDEGNIILLFPESPKALAWIEDNLSKERYTYGRSVIIDHRYFSPIYSAITMEGLSIEQD